MVLFLFFDLDQHIMPREEEEEQLMKKPKRLDSIYIMTIIITLTLSFILVAAVGSPVFAAGKEVKIGFVFSMTGTAAAYGAVQKNGSQLAIDDINAAAGPEGIKITPIFDDDASTAQQGINVFNKFINADKVAVIIGPTLSDTAQVTDRIAQQEGVPVLGISNTAKGITEIGDYVFRDSLTEAVVIPNTIKIAKEKLGIAKVAVLYGNDGAYTKAGYEAFKKLEFSKNSSPEA